MCQRVKFVKISVAAILKRVQLDTVSPLGTRGWKPSRFAGAARMAASARVAARFQRASEGGILPPVGM